MHENIYKKCLAKSYKYHQAHLWIPFMHGNFILLTFLIGTWNFAVASGGGVSGQRLVYSSIFFISDFRNLRICRASMAYIGFRGNRRNQIPQSKPSDWKLHLILQRLSFMGGQRHDLIPPAEGQPHSGEGQRRISQRACGRGMGKGRRGAAELEPLRSPSSSWVRTEMRSRSKMKACSGKRGEAGDDPERVSEHSPQWWQFYIELSSNHWAWTRGCKATDEHQPASGLSF